MKSAKRLSLFVLILAWIVGSVGCGSVEKKPTPTSLTKTDFEKIADDGCAPVDKGGVPGEGLPRWVCMEDAFAKMTELGIRLQERVTSLEKDIKYYDDKLELREQFYEAKLDQWHRKWLITIPLGSGIGVAITLLLVLL